VRIAIIGQQDFGKAVLEAMVGRGDTVAGVFCAPDQPGAKPDLLRVAAEQRHVPVHQLPSLKSAEACEALRALDVELGVMAYVLQFVPQAFAAVPTHGMIQYHPSLLPRYRGPSSINWPIIRGDDRTGITIFRPTDGLDEGPVILQKETPIGPDDTLGSVYFDRLFPMGIDALQEAAELTPDRLLARLVLVAEALLVDLLEDDRRQLARAAVRPGFRFFVQSHDRDRHLRNFNAPSEVFGLIGTPGWRRTERNQGVRRLSPLRRWRRREKRYPRRSRSAAVQAPR